MTITNFLTLNTTEASAAAANMGAIPKGSPFHAFADSDSPYVPMYRAYREATGAHLLTTYIDERDAAVNEDGFVGEISGFWCLPPSATPNSETVPLYRYYNPKVDDYLFSLEIDEVGYPWRPHELACLIFRQSLSNDTVKLNRYRNDAGTQHLIIAASESGPLDGWVWEETLGYVYSSPQGALLPLFRAYNTISGGHLYTLSLDEYDAASQSAGYRGDGISGYIWPDGSAPAGASPLYRAYNKALDDHLYTVGAQTTIVGYDPEGVGPIGWVTSSTGPSAASATAAAVQQFTGNFADDFLLPEIKLGSNSNFFITSYIGGTWNAIMDLTVEVEVTSDLTVDSVDIESLGMSIQLNGISPIGWNSQWQQYMLQQGGTSLDCELQNWSKTNNHAFTAGYVARSVSIVPLSNTTIPVGYRLRISLLNDEFGNILGATFSVTDSENEVTQQEQLVVNLPNGPAFGSAPILGFQLLIVGLGDGAAATFAKGGSGLILYEASTPLFAQVWDFDAFDGVLATSAQTGERSNIVYGQIAATKSKMLSQSFNVQT